MGRGHRPDRVGLRTSWLSPACCAGPSLPVLQSTSLRVAVRGPGQGERGSCESSRLLEGRAIQPFGAGQRDGRDSEHLASCPGMPPQELEKRVPKTAGDWCCGLNVHRPPPHILKP